MSGEIAKAVEALGAFDTTYETTPMGTTLVADDVHELFAASDGTWGGRRRSGDYDVGDR